MLPLTDHNPRHITPVVTYLLVAMNVLMFLWELSLGRNLEPALFNIAFIPARFWSAMRRTSAAWPGSLTSEGLWRG